MLERGALGVAQIVQDGAGGAHGGVAIRQAAAIQREKLEVVAQRAVGVVEAEDPVFEFRAQEARGRTFAGQQRQIGRKQDFARAQVFERAGNFAGFQFGDAELAGGDIHVGHAGALPGSRYGRQVVILVRAQQVRVGGGAGRDDAGDLALHQLLRHRRIFHLVADGDAVALLNQPRDIAFGRMVGHAAHGDGRRPFPCCAR